jgi:hypothetical protein
MKVSGIVFRIAALLLFHPLLGAQAEIRPERIHVADIKKNNIYTPKEKDKAELIIGGDGSIHDFVVNDIRWANQTGFERVVVSLDGYQNDDTTMIARPPYFQLAVTPDEKQLTLSFSGKAKFNFDPNKVLAAFKRSAVIDHVQILPPITEGSPFWIFVLKMKSGYTVEPFELNQPVRVVLDIQKKKE